MLCNRQWKRHTYIIILGLGAASFLFGLITFIVGGAQGHTLTTLKGMFTGFGLGILAVAAYKLIRARVVPAEKQEREKIEEQDERNIAITRAAGLAGFYTGAGLLAALAFLFMGMGYAIPSYLCVGGLYVMAAAYFIARRVISKRM